jgi:putative FmdB family regulatory protein
MPLYEYECDACGHRFEKIQKFSDPLADKCPKCGGPVHKLMSSPAIQFKGSGFYITDYAKKEHVESAKADSANAGKGEKGDSTEKKSETTETKSETPEKKSDAPAKTETAAPAASASKESKSS